MTARIIVGGLLLVSGLAWAEPPAANAPIADVLKELRRIESAAWHGKVELARIELQNVARERPSDPMLRVYIAWCSMPTDDAWNQLKNVSQIHPDLPWVHYGMGRIYVGWKMRDLAKTELEASMKKDSNFYPAILALADMARLKDDLDDAEAKYRQVLAIADDPEAHAGLGLVLLKKNKAAEAQPELARAIQQWPDQPAALRELVKLQQASKDPAFPKNLAFLSELQPKDRDVQRAVAAAMFDAGDKKGALAAYERLIRLGNPDLETANRMQSLSRELGDADGEERAANLVASLDKSIVAPLIRIAELREAKKDLEGAEKILIESLERNRELADTWYRLGKLSSAKVQPVIALERYRRGGALSSPRAEECRTEAKVLEAYFQLPPTPAKGSVDHISAEVSKSLEAFFFVRRKQNPKLKGLLKVRVKVTADGVVESSEVVEDTLGDAALAGHAAFALRDAQFEKKRREPVFEFDLGLPTGKKGK